jgi:hypothetical protein
VNSVVRAVPAPRVDTLVLDPRTDQQRWRTDYGGVVWLGAPPGGGTFFTMYQQVEAGFFVPDGHKYLWDTVGDAVVQATFGLYRAGGTSVHLDSAQASLVPDPRGGTGAYIYAALSAYGPVPVAYTYQIIVLTRPDAVLPFIGGLTDA